MSETSGDKTKRKYLAMLTDHHWSHRYSVFYANPKMSNELLTDMVGFKQALRKQYPDQPFLIRIQTKAGGLDGDKTLQAYLTILTTARSDCLDEVANGTFTSSMNVMSGPLSPTKLKSIASAIEGSKPHDLTKVFGDVRIRRWSVLNTDALIIRK
ncbi:hypothetical protein [Pseudomonas gregormendelii]